MGAAVAKLLKVPFTPQLEVRKDFGIFTLNRQTFKT